MDETPSDSKSQKTNTSSGDRNEMWQNRYRHYRAFWPLRLFGMIVILAVVFFLGVMVGRFSFHGRYGRGYMMYPYQRGMGRYPAPMMRYYPSGMMPQTSTSTTPVGK